MTLNTKRSKVPKIHVYSYHRLPNFTPLFYTTIGQRSTSSTNACTLFLPKGIKIKFILALRVAVFQIRADFQKAIFGHETWPLTKIQKLHIYSLSTPGVTIELIFALRVAVLEILTNYQNCDIWA